MNPNNVVTIAGNMGVGKSTLTQLLADDFGWTASYEAVDDNPYLADFYQDMPRWSFHSQVFFLSCRLRGHREIINGSTSVIQDRSIYEDAEIFARNLYERGAFSKRDYALYRRLYDASIQFLPPPKVIVYLQATVPTLIGRIQRRGRDYEQDVSPLYLQQLNELYNSWIEDFTLCPVLMIPADRLDFVRSPQDFMTIKTLITDQLALSQPVAC